MKPLAAAFPSAPSSRRASRGQAAGHCSALPRKPGDELPNARSDWAAAGVGSKNRTAPLPVRLAPACRPPTATPYGRLCRRPSLSPVAHPSPRGARSTPGDGLWSLFLMSSRRSWSRVRSIGRSCRDCGCQVPCTSGTGNCSSSAMAGMPAPPFIRPKTRHCPAQDAEHPGRSLGAHVLDPFCSVGLSSHPGRMSVGGEPPGPERLRLGRHAIRARASSSKSSAGAGPSDSLSSPRNIRSEEPAMPSMRSSGPLITAHSLSRGNPADGKPPASCHD